MKIIWSHFGQFHIEVTLNSHDLTCLKVRLARAMRSTQFAKPFSNWTSHIKSAWKSAQSICKKHAKRQNLFRDSKICKVSKIDFLVHCGQQECCPNVVLTLKLKLLWHYVAFMKLLRGRLGLLGLPSFTGSLPAIPTVHCGCNIRIRFPSSTHRAEWPALIS